MGPRTLLLALVALALVASGAQAKQPKIKVNTELLCQKDKLNTIGKAAQCQIAAEAQYIASLQKEEDQRRRDGAIDHCRSKLVDGYATAARRYGPPACESSGTTESAGRAVDDATSSFVSAADTYPVCSPRIVVSSCSGIPGVTSTTCGTYYITDNGGKVTTTTSTSCVFKQSNTQCTAGAPYCVCTTTTSTDGPMICGWSNGSCINSGGYCTAN
jgi:hypothetical protein